MGFFDWEDEDDADSVISSSTRKSHSTTHHRSSKSRDSPRSHRSKRPGSVYGGDSHYSKHSSSRGSFFGLGNGSTRSFFSLGGHSNSSYYKRQPRSSFIQRTLKKLRRLLRDLIYYAKRHPIKVFMLVVMPLITGGALTALLARFGLRLPPTIERMLGVAARAGSGDSVGLMNEAVRMAGGMGGGGGGSGRNDSSSLADYRAHARDNYGYGHGDFRWERHREEYRTESHGHDRGFFGSIRDFFS
ncbi:uncharacterized protein F4812DRAFT_421674 [Daldinia caldariorum]|uniref:uncharacterized protein n=1 Tax=Daldinia caldariorum TaxID=326644 RepID=UPI002007ABF5|nr:uncharacterized protein F4812DRAFT_421674 [Daldinia caldariorum]KAI1470156.1 hypothetical protein F4812DRAFT_421674 [Daldinia caldariorum]